GKQPRRVIIRPDESLSRKKANFPSPSLTRPGTDGMGPATAIPTSGHTACPNLQNYSPGCSSLPFEELADLEHLRDALAIGSRKAHSAWLSWRKIEPNRSKQNGLIPNCSWTLRLVCPATVPIARIESIDSREAVESFWAGDLGAP